MLGSGAGARRIRHRHPNGAGGRRHGREEGAIARTPKTTETKRAPRASAAAPSKAPARKATGAATPAKPAAKPKAAAPARAAAKPKPAAAPKAAATPRAAAKAPATSAAKPRAAVAPKAAPKAKAATKARTAPAAKAKPAPKAPAKAPAAPRPPRGRKREKLSPDRLSLLVAAAIKSLEDDKAENIVLLDVTGRADYADRLIIATGQVERQLQAMATHLDEALGKAGLHLRRDAVQASPDWVLIDAGDLVIHLFRAEARELYRIERMWGPESPGASDAAPG